MHPSPGCLGQPQRRSSVPLTSVIYLYIYTYTPLTQVAHLGTTAAAPHLFVGSMAVAPSLDLLPPDLEAGLPPPSPPPPRESDAGESRTGERDAERDAQADRLCPLHAPRPSRRHPLRPPPRAPPP